MSIYFAYALNICTGFGFAAAQILLSLYALEFGASPLAIGVLAGAFSLFPMFLAVRAGRLVDRFGARWPMVFGATGGLGMLVPYFFPGLPALYVAAVLWGLAPVFLSLATQNLVGLLSTPETRPRNFSNYSLCTSIAGFLGPLVTGFSIEHSDHASTCLYLAMFTLVPIAMLVIWGGRLPGGTRRAAKASGGGVMAMLADPVVRQTLMAGALINTGINLYQFYMPVYGHSIQLSPSAIGAIMAMNAAAAFVVRMVMPRLLSKLGQHRLLVYAFFIGAGSLALLPFFHDVVMLALISFVFGFATGCGPPLVIMLMYVNAKDGRSGESLGLKFTTNQVTKLASPIIFGGIASGLGLAPMFWVNAVVLTIGGVLSRPIKKSD